MAQTQAIFGLAGIGFLDPESNEYIGFSATAQTLEITGAFEAVMQKNSNGVHLADFYTIGDCAVSVEGITDATLGMIARLRGGTLVAGSDTLNAAIQVSRVEPNDVWGATAIDVAAGMTPAPGFYTITAGAVDVIHRVFTSGLSNIVVGGAPVVATADFTVASKPSTAVNGAVGGFFVEPITADGRGEYVFGSNNLPDIVSVFAVSSGRRNADPDGRNEQRIYIPRFRLGPIAQRNEANGLFSLGTISGMALHDSGIGGTYRVTSSLGIS